MHVKLIFEEANRRDFNISASRIYGNVIYTNINSKVNFINFYLTSAKPLNISKDTLLSEANPKVTITQWGHIENQIITEIEVIAGN